jgi:thermitase
MTGTSHFVKNLCLLVVGVSLSLTAYGEEYLVKVKNSFTIESFSNQLQTVPNVKVLDQHDPGHLILIRTAPSLTQSSIEVQLKTLEAFEYVVPNIRFHIKLPNDPQLSRQWALQKIGAEKAWELSNSTARPIVAVIDTGVDYKHEDLASQILRDDKGNVKGWNYIEDNNDPMDITSSTKGGNPGHGTHCAGIIAATHDNGIGVSGVANKVWIMPLRFIGPDGSGDLMNSIKAIDFAIQNGAQIISASWGAAVQRSVVKPLIEAIERAGQKGLIFVAAAANDGKSNDTREVYPANAGLPNVISVAASDRNDGKPTWSNYGRVKVDLASPGAGILSTLPNNGYGELSGTSMATPLVAGLVSVLLAQSLAEGRSYNGPELKALLQAHSQQVQIETACHCRISADQSMLAIKENKLTVVPNAGGYGVGEQAKFHAIGGHAPYHFTSSNAAVASITDEGDFKAIANGVSTLQVTDADGHTALSQEIFVGASSKEPAPPGGGGGGGQCPFPDPQMCEIICKIMPKAPWCNKIEERKMITLR